MISWHDWLLSPARVAVHEATRTAVAADLHLGYAEARRRSGDAVPILGVAESLIPLATLIRRMGLTQLVVAGDLFEAGPVESVVDEFASWLNEMALEKVELVLGNHDRKRKPPAALSGFVESCVVGGWTIVHGDGVVPECPFVQGHLHPAVRVKGVAEPLPCFLARDGHLVLPAFSCDARGTAIRERGRWAGYRRFAVAGECVSEV